MSRFDYVKYDEKSAGTQELMKSLAQNLEMCIDAIGRDHSRAARSKALALTSLEECYMWIGKAIRDDQVFRDANTQLNEVRG